MSFICLGCGEKLKQTGKKTKIICQSCGVLTDLRDQGFVQLQESNGQINHFSRINPSIEKNQAHNQINENESQVSGDPSDSDSKKEKHLLSKIVPNDYQSSNADDGLGYSLTNSSDFYCPGCGKIMESVQIVCLNCGYHIDKGNKLRRKHVVISRQWIEGLNKNTRIMIAIASFFLFVLVSIATINLGYVDLMHSCTALFFASLQIVYLTGTYGTCLLNRSSKGKVIIARITWVGFIPISNKIIPSEGHDGIKLTQAAHAGTIEYLIFFILFIPFIFPAIIWYFSVIQGTTFEVALTKDMGRSVDFLFRSRNENQAKEIAVLLSQISKLPLNQR